MVASVPRNRWPSLLLVLVRVPRRLPLHPYNLLPHRIRPNKPHDKPCPCTSQITLSHFAMSTSDLGVAESFPQKMLRTTMDVDCPAWLDFVHGGLQFQAVHHLFPRVPRHNLRKCQGMVREFCEEVGIPYAVLRVWRGKWESCWEVGGGGEAGKNDGRVSAEYWGEGCFGGALIRWMMPV